MLGFLDVDIILGCIDFTAYDSRRNYRVYLMCIGHEKRRTEWEVFDKRQNNFIRLTDISQRKLGVEDALREGQNITSV